MYSMAKNQVNIEAQCRQIVKDAGNGRFSPVYLLMGEEPYYPEMVCKAILDHCIPEEDKDFNETVCYGADVDADHVVTLARRYPMMSERQLVVVKEAQMMKDIEGVAAYCKAPLDSRVLVLLLRGASLDKRKALYKEISRCGTVVDSPAVRDYAIAGWISDYYAGRGDVEKNVGVSRQFSIFELTRELSSKNAPKALSIAAHIGTSARFNMPMAVSALYTHFYRILKYAAAGGGRGQLPADIKARALAGVNPYFYREYDTAVRNYPLPSAMAAISLLCEYDWLGKGGNGQSTEPGELLRELVARLLAL